jgi:effector-binding domain-containing protein
MDNLTFSVEDVPGARVLSARTVAPQAELGEAIGRVLASLYGVVGAQATGVPVCVYPEPYDPERVVAEPGLPYDGPAPYGYVIHELPGGRAVVGHLTGGYEQLPGAWQAVMAYVGEQGLELGGAPYERYRVGMGQAEPAAFETDIVIPLK